MVRERIERAWELAAVTDLMAGLLAFHSNHPWGYWLVQMAIDYQLSWRLELELQVH